MAKFLIQSSEKCTATFSKHLARITEKSFLVFDKTLDDKNFNTDFVLLYAQSKINSACEVPIPDAVIENLESAVTLLMAHEAVKARDKNVIADMSKDMFETFVAKNHDYSDPENSMYNFNLAALLVGIDPVKGILNRAVDKISRLENLRTKGEAAVKDETTLDTIKDLCNYLIIAMVYAQDREYTAKDIIIAAFFIVKYFIRVTFLSVWVLIST